MRSLRIFVTLVVVITLAVVGSNFVFAASTPKYYGVSGGEISGMVVSPSGSVVDWAQVYARAGNQTFQAFSGFSGFYLMRVPAGTYNVSVYDFYNPPYWAPSVTVNVTEGSSTTVNFYLQQQPPSAVPEFEPNLLALVSMLTVAATSILTGRLRKRSISL